MSTRMSDQIKVPETTTPHQSPQQKQLKIADLNAHSTAPVPMTAASQPNYHISSQVMRPQMPEQSLLHSALQKTEVQMEGVGHSQRSLSPLAWERQRSDMGLCPQKSHFCLNQVLDARMMDVLCLNHQDEFIYRTTYKINIGKYNHYRDDLKVFGNNAEEILLQVINMCTWAHEYHQKTQQTLDPYLPYMLRAQSP